MKRIISFIVVAVILCVSLSGYAVSNPEISVTSANADVDGSVKVDVKISNNPGIASYKLKLNFDKTKLKPVSISGSDITSNIQQPGADLSSLEYVSAVWVNESDSNSNGVLFSVEFEVVSTESATVPITLSYNKGEICNQNLEDVDPVLSNGTITINKKTESYYNYTINSYDGRTVNISCPTTASVTEKDLVIVAKYNSNDILIDCEVVSIKLEAGKSSGAQCTKNILPQSGETVKIMLWNSDLMPLAVPLKK